MDTSELRASHATRELLIGPQNDRDRQGHGFRRLLLDVLSQLSSAALLVGSLAAFLGGAIAGLTMIGRLGAAGWFMYLLVMSTYALVFGPVLAGAVTIHQNGSRRHRETVQRRIEEQREFFGLHLRTKTAVAARDGSADRPPQQRTLRPRT